MTQKNGHSTVSHFPPSLYPLEDELVLDRLRVPPLAQSPTWTATDPWQVMRMQSELMVGFDALAHIPPSVTIFGSARTVPGSPEYETAVETAYLLAKAGFGIITGGGPGIMEAANKGAQVGGGCSIGCTIEMPAQEPANRYLDVAVHFRSFFVRKTMFITFSSAFVIFPGGFGTIDELFEALNLIQNKKIPAFPVILVGTRYWKGLVNWVRDTMVSAGKIAAADMDCFCLSDDPEEMCRMVVQGYQDHYRSQPPPSLTAFDQSLHARTSGD